MQIDRKAGLPAGGRAGARWGDCSRQEAQERLREVLVIQDAQKRPRRERTEHARLAQPLRRRQETDEDHADNRAFCRGRAAASAWATGEVRSVRGGNHGMVEAGLAEAVPVEATPVQWSRSEL
jgi:hypothetical protein